MVATIKSHEGEPASLAEPAWAWQRIETWIDRRWPQRDVQFVVEGPGGWTPPIWPVTFDTVEFWRDGAWVATDLDPHPVHAYDLPCGTHRFTGLAGDNATPPAAVLEAVARLVAYHETAKDLAPFTSRRTQVGDVMEDVDMPALNVARALTQSGAADLLRRWRKPR